MSRCNCIYVANALTSTATELILNFDSIPVLKNTKQFVWEICPNLGEAPASALPVSANVSVNGTITAVPLINKFGNRINSNELIKGIPYEGYMGSIGSNKITVLNSPC